MEVFFAFEYYVGNGICPLGVLAKFNHRGEDDDLSPRVGLIRLKLLLFLSDQ